jgi:CRP-like cAMP-binding protein
MILPLLQHIKKFVPVNEEDEKTLLSFIRPLSVKKKQILLEEGQVCRSNYFVASGCLRMYFINDKGAEQITQFAIENWWITDYLSFDMQSPAHFFVQALEDSELLVLDRSKQDELLHQLPALEKYFRIILQKASGAAQLRIKYLFDLSGEERYHHFNNLFPGFVQRIPQYMLASYLGFTPEFLSKIRGKQSR